jgi:hypothetical protein
MTTRSAVAAAARSLIGTRYHAYGRKAGVGVDCVGLPIVAGWISGALPLDFDVRGYSMQPDGTLLSRCDEVMERVPQSAMQEGDVIVVRWGKEPHHFGVLGLDRWERLTIIHAENWKHKKVVEHRLCFTDNAMRFVAAFCLPGVEA